MRINHKKLLNSKIINQILNHPKNFFIVLILILVTLFTKEYIVNPQSLEVKVVKVIDGDTINVLEGNKIVKIRLFGIDAPESKQEFGIESKNFLASMIGDKKIRIIYKDKDKYGRILALIKFEDKDINKIMVNTGHAWAYSYYSDMYLREQKLAQEKKLGLWKNKNPLEPYKWRKQNRF
ncbi:thermonuclease family protein [Campylobacter cuniculorum]|uniref:thermonuclease family protein n=1 Tax=Campylobacter cuniculorum TaxID=374106 RepID=UPI0023F34BCF|nr:thermonuclease family protein [Campylobacter cuniculorum]